MPNLRRAHQTLTQHSPATCSCEKCSLCAQNKSHSLVGNIQICWGTLRTRETFLPNLFLDVRRSDYVDETCCKHGGYDATFGPGRVWRQFRLVGCLLNLAVKVYEKFLKHQERFIKRPHKIARGEWFYIIHLPFSHNLWCFSTMQEGKNLKKFKLMYPVSKRPLVTGNGARAGLNWLCMRLFAFNDPTS